MLHALSRRQVAKLNHFGQDSKWLWWLSFNHSYIIGYFKRKRIPLRFAFEIKWYIPTVAFKWEFRLLTIVKITFKCVKDTINTQNRKHSFEIFGFDFIVDKDVNVFLLEVNTNPGLELSSPLITKLVPRMIDDALRLSVDLLFPNETEKDKNKTYNSKFPVDNYSNSENMYDFLGNINEKWEKVNSK